MRYQSSESIVQQLVHAVSSNFAAVVVESTVFSEITLRTDTANLLSLVKFLRDDPACLCQQLMDVCGVDYPSRENRFNVVYNFLSLVHNVRVRVKVAVAEGELVPTLIPLFPCANWWERETWDMYGIPFADHPDLRRILTDYGFEGHPLRKDFPLTGYVEVRYNPDSASVVYEPVHGMQNVLNGDEKARQS